MAKTPSSPPRLPGALIPVTTPGAGAPSGAPAAASATPPTPPTATRAAGAGGATPPPPTPPPASPAVPTPMPRAPRTRRDTRANQDVGWLRTTQSLQDERVYRNDRLVHPALYAFLVVMAVIGVSLFFYVYGGKMYLWGKANGPFQSPAAISQSAPVAPPTVIYRVVPAPSPRPSTAEERANEFWGEVLRTEP